MANERLGIFEELHAKAYRYGILKREPVVAGPKKQRPPPQHEPRVRLRMRHPKPFHDRSRSDRRRRVWPEAKLAVPIDVVVEAVLSESGIAPEYMFGVSRARRYAWPRAVAMWAIDRYCPQYSLSEIGYMFWRDHTTAMSAIEACQRRLDEGERVTCRLVDNVRDRLQHEAERAA